MATQDVMEGRKKAARYIFLKCIFESKRTARKRAITIPTGTVMKVKITVFRRHWRATSSLKILIKFSSPTNCMGVIRSYLVRLMTKVQIMGKSMNVKKRIIFGESITSA
jgi:hypothetical protein